MGRHNFEELKQLATKNFGMHQNRLLAQAGRSSLVDDETMAKVGSGMCATLTTYWIAEQLRDDKTGSYFRYEAPGLPAAKVKAIRTDRQALMLSVLSPKHARYVELRTAGDMRPGLLILAPPGVQGEAMPSMAFDDLVTFDFKAGRAYYVTLICDKARHAIGIIGQHRATLTFFDPNAGEYEIKGLLFDRFLSAYKEIIATSLKWGQINSIVVSEASIKA